MAKKRTDNLPLEIPGEAVLLHLAGAELREAERHTAGDRAGAVELRVRSDEEHLLCPKM